MSESSEEPAPDVRGASSESEALQRYRRLLNAIDDAVLEFGPDGRVQAANDAAVELTGYDREELLGAERSLLFDGTAGEDPTAGGADGSRAAAATRQVTLSTADGRRLACELRTRPLEGDPGGTAYTLRADGEAPDPDPDLDPDRREGDGRGLDDESELRTLAENLDQVVWMTTDDPWELLYVNAAFEEVYGRERDSLYEDPELLFDVVHPEDREAVREEFEGDVAEPSDVEYRIVRPDGEVRWIRDRARPVRDEEGEVRRVVGNATDVTRRKERERQLSALIDNVPGMVYRCRNERGWPMEFVSEACEEVTGHPPEALESGDVSWGEDLMLKEDRQMLWETVQEEAGKGRTFSATYRIETADGDLRWVRDYGRGVFEDGEIVAVEGIIADVTDRKRIEQELRESEAKFRTLAENLDEIVWMSTPDAEEILYVNPAYEAIWGRDRESLYEETYSFLEGVHPEDRQRVRESYAALPHSEYDEEFRIVRPDGEVRWLHAQAVPVREDGDLVRIVGIATDVTDRKERERELREANAQLEAAIEAGAVGTWEWHVPEDRMVTGESFATLFDVDPEAAREGVSLERFVSAIHEGDRERVEAKIDEALESCGEYEAEYRVWNADGDLRWVFARGRVECDESGEPVSFPGAVADITDRKRAEQELEQTKRQLETLFEVLPVGVVVADADGSLRRANDVARDIWGGDVFDAEEVADYDRYDGWWVDTGERVAPEEWTMARVLDGEAVTDPDVVEIETAGGERRTVAIRGMPIRDESGEVVRGVVTQSDITEPREYQRKLETSERRHRTLVENFPNGAVGLFDEDLEYTAVGGRYFEETATETEDRIGNSVHEIYPEDLVEELEPRFRATLDGEESEFEIEFNDRHLHVHTVPVRDADGEIYAGMVVAEDVTERREYERKLEESNERLEQFAYAASHDLQEPLRMVSSYLQLLERRYGDELGEDGQEFLEFAVDGADRMKAMIEGLLEYSRVESRGDPFEPVDLERLLEEVVEDLQFRLDESGADVGVEPLPTVEGDASQLRQVFQNLLDNAIEYSGEEPPRVHVSAEREGDEWVVSVADEGIGIDPDDQGRVFEVFQRLHSREEHEGTGIGLALCRRIVERHGGRIWVDSEPGEGATFSFTLPAADAAT